MSMLLDLKYVMVVEWVGSLYQLILGERKSQGDS